jgi:TetR/AcrR family transcriptional regulator, cholesterol catabolism regulator
LTQTETGKESKKEQILRTAAGMFCEKTYHGTTLQNIAEEVGLLKGSLYYYITSKEKLLADIITSAVYSLNEGLVRVENTGIPPEEKLRRIIGEHVRFNAEYREAGTLFLTERHILNTLEMDDVSVILSRRDKLLNDTLREAVDKGIYRAMDYRLMSLSIIGLCNSLLFWYRPEGRLNYDIIADNFFDIIHRGLVVRTES